MSSTVQRVLANRNSTKKKIAQLKISISEQVSNEIYCQIKWNDDISLVVQCQIALVQSPFRPTNSIAQNLCSTVGLADQIWSRQANGNQRSAQP